MASSRTLCRDMAIKFPNYNPVMAKRIFEMFGKKSTGYFIDIGAAHPWVNSHTYFLEQEGWDGICVEPNINFVELLKSHRECTIIDAAVWDKDGQAAFNNGVEGSALVETGYRCNACYNWINSVRTITVSTLLEEFDVPKKIDFINVDAQFAEHRFYKDLPMAQVILMEIHDESYTDDILAYFDSCGYKVEKLEYADYLFIRLNYIERIKKWIYLKTKKILKGLY